MRTILRPAAVIESWFDTLNAEQQEMARLLRDNVVAAAPTLAMAIKWGNLMFTQGGSHAVAIVMHRTHANLQFFNGAQLAERFPELEGAGRSVRHLRFSYRQPIDEALVRSVVSACVETLREPGV